MSMLVENVCEPQFALELHLQVQDTLHKSRNTIHDAVSQICEEAEKLLRGEIY